MHLSFGLLMPDKYLEGSAADYMQTALRSVPVVESSSWPNFCALLSARFGQIDPDAELWDQLHDLRQGSLTAAHYVHKMRYCFNGITVLPSSNGEKIHRFITGLNPRVREKVVTAPYDMGDGSGKWLDPDQLMQHTVLQAQALLNGGAVMSSSSASAGQKHAPDGGAQGPSKKKLKKQSNGNGFFNFFLQSKAEQWQWLWLLQQRQEEAFWWCFC